MSEFPDRLEKQNRIESIKRIETTVRMAPARSVRGALALVAVAAWLMSWSAVALAQESSALDRVSIETLVPYAESAEIMPAIREECGLGTKLSRKLAAQAGKRGIAIVRVGNLDEVTQGRALGLRITDALTSGGFLSSKSLTVDGVLKNDGKIVGTFVARRFARAGFFSLSRSDCAVLSKAAAALSRDISKFITRPRMDARLGDAR